MDTNTTCNRLTQYATQQECEIYGLTFECVGCLCDLTSIRVRVCPPTVCVHNDWSCEFCLSSAGDPPPF